MSEEETDYPVYVIESIPAGGENELSPEEIEQEGIPTPDHLRLFGELARGGMGRIHAATDRNLLRHVALKRLDKALAKVPMYHEGFIAEAQMTGQLEHPNIVPVHELNIGENGVPYFTMKLVQGISLEAWFHEEQYAVGSAERLSEGLEIFLKICDAVAYAHHRGVIHRDLKPENIMVAGFGQVYVMDWGLARLSKTRPASGADSQMEAEGPVGTPAYMAPEQARGKPDKMNERSDVFGLGAILYELASGRTPYGYGRLPDEILERAAAGEVIPIKKTAAALSLSASLLGTVVKGVASDPAERYESVVELQAAVRQFLHGGLHLPRRVYAAGETIIQEGDVGHAAFMIVSGNCRAYRTVDSKQEPLATMGAGDVFGEVALLLEEPRAASVEAVDTVTVLILDKSTMTVELGIDGWAGALVRALAQRFVDLERHIRSSGVRRE